MPDDQADIPTMPSSRNARPYSGCGLGLMSMVRILAAFAFHRSSQQIHPWTSATSKLEHRTFNSNRWVPGEPRLLRETIFYHRSMKEKSKLKGSSQSLKQQKHQGIGPVQSTPK